MEGNEAETTYPPVGYSKVREHMAASSQDTDIRRVCSWA